MPDMNNEMSRREFLGAAAMGAVGALTLPERRRPRSETKDSGLEEAYERFRQEVVKGVLDFFGVDYIKQHPELYERFILSGAHELMDKGEEWAEFDNTHLVERIEKEAMDYIQTEVRVKGEFDEVDAARRKEILTHEEIAVFKKKLVDKNAFSSTFRGATTEGQKYISVNARLLQARELSHDRVVRENCTRTIKALLEYNRSAWARWGEEGGLPYTYRTRRKADIMYPMDVAGALFNYATALRSVWKDLEDKERQELLDPLKQGIAVFKKKAEEFHGLLPRYLGLRAGERLSPQAAPDDTIAHPVGKLACLGSVLREIGEHSDADKAQELAQALMQKSDEIFWTQAEFADSRGRKRVYGKSMGRCDLDKAKEKSAKEGTALSEAARTLAEEDVPADGTRLPEARLELVRGLLDDYRVSSDERAHIITHIERALAELRMYVYLARHVKPLLIVDDEKGMEAPIEKDSVRVKFFGEKTLATNGLGKIENLQNPQEFTRYLNIRENEGTHREGPRAFAALFHFMRDTKVQSRLKEVVGQDYRHHIEK